MHLLRCAQQLVSQRQSLGGVYAGRFGERIARNIWKAESRQRGRQVAQNPPRSGGQQFANGFKENLMVVVAPRILPQPLKQFLALRDIFVVRAQELQQLLFIFDAGNGIVLARQSSAWPFRL